MRRENKAAFRMDLPAILGATRQPSIDSVNTWFVAKAAREAGLKVALSGLGGDELLAGYPSFRALHALRRRFGPLAGIHGLGRLALILMTSQMPGVLRSCPKAAGIITYFGSIEGTYLLGRSLFLPHELRTFLDPSLLADGLRELKPLERKLTTLTPNPRAETARVCVLEPGHCMRSQFLRDVDWAGMAHWVEIRTQLADTVLLVNTAPITPALEPGEGKAALPSAPSQALPRAVAARA
jgi:asparagine synthase (glutamine-hydrolysing)